jgi:aminopeptidase N
MKLKILLVTLLTSSLIDAQTPDSIWQRSLRRFEQQDFHGVIADMDTLLGLAPVFSNALYNKGIARIKLGDIEGACVDLELAQKMGMLSENRQFIDYMCDPEFIRKIILKQAYKKESVLPELGYRPRYTRADTLRGALRPERTCFDVYFYDLRVKIIPITKRIEGGNTIYFHVVQPTRKIQIDLFDNYNISGIFWNGVPLVWHREFNALFIDFPRELPAGENHNISITYRGKPVIAPNPPWDGGFVWKRDRNKKRWIGVACEHLGASSWWPNKDHLSDKPDSMRMRFEIPKGYQAVSNGNLRKVETVNKRYNRFTWFVDYPINNYNATFYIGDYTSFNDTVIQGNDTLRLDYNVLKYNLDIASEHFKQTRDVVSFYNKAFGFYPFAKDGFGLVESPYEGMEHQSAIAYGNGYNKNNAQEYRNQIYDYIIVHEAAHEWWGNSVTAADMADIWIHEGFATYAEYMFLENRFGKDEYMYELEDKSRYIFNIWPMVQNRNVNENTFASNDVYNKGAMLLHCLRCTINNDSLFFSILHDFCTSNRYKTVTSNDFVAFVNRYTASDYTAFFNKYLYDTKLPVLEYTFRDDSGDLIIKYRWTGVEEGFVMPFGIGTNNKVSLRLVAGTNWKEERIPQTAWFNFFNIWRGYEGSADNSFTYFYTRCSN